VVTDDFVYAEPVSVVDAEPISLEDDSAILPGAAGTLNAQPKATATVATAFNGVVATFSDDTGGPPATASQFQPTINWGAGHTTNGKVKANGSGGFDVVGTNTFGTAGLIPVNVLIKDFGGAKDLIVSSVIKVTAATTTTTLTVSPSPAIAGQEVTLT